MFSAFISGSFGLIAAAVPLQLSDSLCGPPTEVIAAVEARGYVYEPNLSVTLPPGLTVRSDLVLIAYLLGPRAAREESRATSGFFGQSILWILRTDREPGRPRGWACVYKESPIQEKDRRAMFDRAKRVDLELK